MDNVQIITIGNASIAVKEYQDKRVVTLKDIDLCHNRPDGTARRNFNQNKQHFIEGTECHGCPTAQNDMKIYQC